MASESASLPTGEIRVEKPVDLNVHRKLLAILNSAQAIISEGSNIKMLRQVLEKLQEILMLLPEKENLFEGLVEEVPFDIKMRRISRRLFMLSEELQKGVPFPENNELNARIDKTELEMRLQEVFKSDPAIKKPRTSEQEAARIARMEAEMKNWSNNLLKQNRKYLKDTDSIIEQALQVLETVKEINFRDIRLQIRDKLKEVIKDKAVPSFLDNAYKATNGVCFENFPELAEMVRQLHQNLPRPEQIQGSGFTRAQICLVQSKVQQCISKLEEGPDKQMEDLIKEIRNAKNLGRSRKKSDVRRSQEENAQARKIAIIKEKKSKRAGRNKL